MNPKQQNSTGKEKKLLTAIVPCYNEEEAIPFFYAEITRVASLMPQTDFEFLFIDDGSRDGTLRILRELAAKDERVRYVSFSRNFGKESAMLAGLENSRGDYIAVMDADLQDPPALLPEMLGALENEGYDAVSTRRSTRTGEPPIRSFFANMFYSIINSISKTKMVPAARDYSLMTRRVVDSILSLKEYNRFSKGIFNWVGYKVKWLSYDNIQRVAGTTKWSFWKLFKYSIECIVAFSTAPLTVPYVCGGACLASSFIWFVIALILDICRPLFGAAPHYLGCLILLVGGMILLSIGIIGTYLSKAYLEIKARPMYFTAETEEDVRGNTGEEK